MTDQRATPTPPGFTDWPPPADRDETATRGNLAALPDLVAMAATPDDELADDLASLDGSDPPPMGECHDFEPAELDALDDDLAAAWKAMQ